MLETTPNLSMQDNSSGIHPTHQFSLPLIGKNKVSIVKDDSELSEKQKLTLPLITTPHQNPSPSHRRLEANQDHKGKQFAKEVKAKLDLVLGQMSEAYHTAEEARDDSDDQDFEAKINENKEIIKKHRLQNPKDSPKNKRAQVKMKKELKQRNQSLYQKRVKYYRDQLIGNKYLHKKKQFAKVKFYQNPNGMILEGQKQSKPKEEYLSIKNSKKQASKQVNQRKSISPAQRQSKNTLDSNKSSLLFDGIQNVLQNPEESMKKELKKAPVGLSLLKAKRDIQDKIGAINIKLGVSEESQVAKIMLIKSMDMQSGLREWRKIEISPHSVESHSSNFDKQLQRISQLQQKNEIWLERYLEQQKIMVELQLRQKQLERKAHANSH